MDRPKIRNLKVGPEAKIQAEIIEFLQRRQWFVKETHGNAYQSGFPDLYAVHVLHGTRWIEVKNPDNYSFTPAQLKDFPMFSKHGAGVWIMTAATEREYACLSRPENWVYYLHMLNTRGCRLQPEQCRDGTRRI